MLTPISPDSGVFLKLIVASDCVDSYKAIEGEPKLPHVWVDAGAEQSIILDCLFSGLNYGLEDHACAVATANPNLTGIVVM